MSQKLLVTLRRNLSKSLQVRQCIKFEPLIIIDAVIPVSIKDYIYLLIILGFNQYIFMPTESSVMLWRLLLPSVLLVVVPVLAVVCPGGKVK